MHRYARSPCVAFDYGQRGGTKTRLKEKGILARRNRGATYRLSRVARAR